MTDDDEAVEDLEGGGGDGEEVDADGLTKVVVQEGLPSLTFPFVSEAVFPLRQGLRSARTSSMRNGSCRSSLKSMSRPGCMSGPLDLLSEHVAIEIEAHRIGQLA